MLKVINEQNLVPHDRVKNHIFRMYAMSRTLNTVPTIIRDVEITNHDHRDGQVFFPRKEVIMSYDIVICTFSSASRYCKL